MDTHDCTNSDERSSKMNVETSRDVDKDQKNDVNTDPFTYLHGFGNELESECLKGALPQSRNNPREVPFGLYAEQLSGTAFTCQRHETRRTWLYRIHPSVGQGASVFAKEEGDWPLFFGHVDPQLCEPTVDALRWQPKPSNQASQTDPNVDFVQGCHLMCHGGSPATKHGLAIYVYEFNKNMTHTCFQNSDGEMLLVPQQGMLHVHTEMGSLQIRPDEICVIPRGIVFSVHLVGSPSASGYLLEVYGGTGFQLPELGPIGSNGLANARDFQYPTAACDNVSLLKGHPAYTKIVKMQSRLFVQHPLAHSPYNVVAWHGNYLPYKYDLNKFCAVNSVTYDHIDPSIYTVLTCPSGIGSPGTALCDFVIFPPRYLATDSNTLRPPWFHRNTMSEYMGLIRGQYDAKPTGFVPGGASLHNCMVPHGPSEEAYKKAVADPCTSATFLNQGLAFMFETYLPLHVAPQALLDDSWRDIGYASSSWQGFSSEGTFHGWQALELAQQSQERQREDDKQK